MIRQRQKYSFLIFSILALAGVGGVSSLRSAAQLQIGVVTTPAGPISVIPPGWQEAGLLPADVEAVAYTYNNQSVQINLPKDNQGGEAATVFVAPYGSADSADADADGIADDKENQLAEQFAPIIIHDRDDLNLPASVDWILRRAFLEYYNDNGLLHKDDHQPIGGPGLTQSSLLGKVGTGKGGNPVVHSDGTRTSKRQHTFAILDLQKGDQLGSVDTIDWKTYVHVFRNYYGGVTIQYWRCYAFNTGDQTTPSPFEFDHHGGDWEAIQVILGKDLKALSFGFLGHTTIETKPLPQVQLERNHVKVFSEPGGHASHPSCDALETRNVFGITYRLWLKDLNRTPNSIRQETWSGGKVIWPTSEWRSHVGGIATLSGGLVNVGEKVHPLNGQLFVQYSGLWGSLGTNFSGYWGPAYNETKLAADGFITAWAYGMKASKDNVANLRGECYAADVSD